MTDRALTDAQARALVWLPADGAWVSTPRAIAAAVQSLELYHKRLVISDWGWSCGRRPYDRLHYRLTDAGIAARAKIEAPEELT